MFLLLPAVLAALSPQVPPTANAPTPWRVAVPGAPPERCAAAYLVVAVDLGPAPRDDGYRRAADAAAAFHHAAVAAWDGRDFAALAQLLRDRRPRDVLFVLRPDTLDLVLHRRLLLLSATLDDDPLPDVAFGYLTAEDGAGCASLWRRTEALHGKGTLRGEWVQASVCSGEKSFRYANGVSPLQQKAGFTGPHFYFATSDPGREAVVAEALAAAARGAVVEFTGCGDPQGIWLFSDRRNLQRDRHWDYAPERVGEDPAHEMPRLLAERFRTLSFASPVVWSGTCHSGAVDRVFVEGDIVSTFGRTQVATVHRLAPRDSLALSWIAAGAVALCVPIGANHGLVVAMETDFALEHGASLGDAVKSTWDDVFLAAAGKLVLDLPVAGEPHRHGEAVMQGGGANRILLGDPALRPFARADNPAESTQVDRGERGCRVTVKRAAGFLARGWDMFGQSRPDDWRVTACVDLGAAGLLGHRELEVVVAATGDGGKAMPYTLRHAVVEDRDGVRRLHLQANATRALVENKAVTAVFDVRARD